MIDDPDNPEWTADDFSRAVRVEDLPAEEQDALSAAFPATGRRLGRPPKPDRKTPVSLRLDPDVLAYFRATGDGWQSRINTVLRESMRARRS